VTDEISSAMDETPPAPAPRLPAANPEPLPKAQPTVPQSSSEAKV